MYNETAINNFSENMQTKYKIVIHIVNMIVTWKFLITII